MDTQRERRGHDFFPPQSVMQQIPALHATENTER
jgi:hypothetical protein